MVPMVYFAAAWCLFWIAYRIIEIMKAPALPRTLRVFPETRDPEDTSKEHLLEAIWDAFTMPSVLKYKPMMWVFLMIFHAGLLVLFLAHLDLLPQINIMSPGSPHMIGNGAVGVALTVCALYFLFRRFRSPVREVSVPADYLLLFLLFCIFVSGDVISWCNSWSENGFVMTKQDFGAYMDGLIRFTFEDPRKVLTGGHYAVIGTHVLLANLFLLVLPFSKIMHVFFAVPMNKLRRG
jgi:nitrate reductase gamma subunit